MRRQGNGSQPAHHHTTQREGSRLGAQLQRHGPAQTVHLYKVGTRHGALLQALAVADIASAGEEYHHEGYRHYHARPHGGDTGSEQAQLGEGTYAVDEQPVEEDVDHVAANHYPHRHLCAGDAVEELLQGIEHAHEGDAHQVDQEVGADDGQQLLGLADVVQVQVEQRHHCHEQQSHHHVGHYRVLYLLPDFVGAAHAEEAAHDGGKSVREAEIEEQSQGEDVVDQSGCTQLDGAVVAYHQRVGKAEDDGAQLSDDDGHSYFQEGAIMVSLCLLHS